MHSFWLLLFVIKLYSHINIFNANIKLSRADVFYQPKKINTCTAKLQ